jgi:phage replication-related protein YjqB (UPF0714/DUF867 family)
LIDIFEILQNLNKLYNVFEKKQKAMSRRRNTITTAYTATFVANNDKFPSLSHREHCAVSSNQIEKIGLSQGQQIRVLRPTANGTKLALYTIKDVHDDGEYSEDTVLVGYGDQDDLQQRLQLPQGEHCFEGKIDVQATAEGLDDYKAKENSEFIEHLCDGGQNTGLIVIAPHGGDIEKYTDGQAQYVYEQLLSSNRVSTWICKGFNKHEDGGAFNRWHITSIDISDKSFPKLKTVYQRGFEYAVAFHGFNDETYPKSVCIGGLVDKTLKYDIKTAIRNEDSEIDIFIDSECPRDINGDKKNNIVNRLSTNGLQIEQTEEVRDDLRFKIADAVVKVLGPKIKV